jgi:uncharacterized membrane protein YgaE (UPF0421/DUF939 family)
LYNEKFNKMDLETKEVVKNIAQIQIEALTNILNNLDNTEPDLLRKLLQITDDDIRESLIAHIQVYKEILEMPQLIKTLPEYQLFVCSHILFRMEDEWISDNSQGVYGTWALLQTETKKFHPELTLIF